MKWRNIPLDPTCKTFIEADTEATKIFQHIEPSWDPDNPNWESLASLLMEKRRGDYTLEDVRSMSVREYQMAITRLILKGDVEPASTHVAEVVLPAGERHGTVRLNPKPIEPQPLVIDRTERAILDALSIAKHPMRQADLLAQLDGDDEVCDRTLRGRLDHLRQIGLIHRPIGERGGDAITDAGRKLLDGTAA